MADEKSVSAAGKSEDSPGSEAAADSADKSLSPTTKLSDLTIDHLSAIIASEVRRGLDRVATPVAGVHVNSGPPGFVNGGGHANFDPKTSGSFGSIGNPAGVHVNSGPPGFVNGGGHANFDPKTSGSFGSIGNPAGVHVNSGPPGFVNGGGHANFDPKSQFGQLINVTLPDGGQVAIPAAGSFNMKVRGFTVQR